ncbi:hypothetical protein E2320_001808, partial [Naja naja]
ELSTQQKVHAKELHKILKQQSKTGGISLRVIEELITEIGYQCPWYPEKGSLDLGDWIKIEYIYIQNLELDSTSKCKEAVETVGFHSLKAPGSLLPQEASAPPSYVQLTLPAPTSMLPETSEPHQNLQSKKRELTSEELTEGLNAFPVQEKVDAQGQIQYEWTTLPYTVLRELRKSISETGLRHINAYHLIPQDWKDMMHASYPSNMWYGIQNIRGMQFRQETTQGISQTNCMGQGLLAIYNNKLQAFLQLPTLLLAVVFYMPLKKYQLQGNHQNHSLPSNRVPTNPMQNLLIDCRKQYRDR